MNATLRKILDLATSRRVRVVADRIPRGQDPGRAHLARGIHPHGRVAHHRHHQRVIEPTKRREVARHLVGAPSRHRGQPCVDAGVGQERVQQRRLVARVAAGLGFAGSVAQAAAAIRQNATTAASLSMRNSLVGQRQAMAPIADDMCNASAPPSTDDAMPAWHLNAQEQPVR